MTNVLPDIFSIFLIAKSFEIDSGNSEFKLEHYYSFEYKIYCTLDYHYRCLYFYKNFQKDKHVELKFDNIDKYEDLEYFFIKSLRLIKLNEISK